MRILESVRGSYDCVFSSEGIFSVVELESEKVESFYFIFHFLNYKFDTLTNLLLTLFETPLTDGDRFRECFEAIRSEICLLWKALKIKENKIKYNIRNYVFMYIVEEYSIYSVRHYIHTPGSDDDTSYDAPKPEVISKARDRFVEFSLTLYTYVWSDEVTEESFIYAQINEMALRYCESFVYRCEALGRVKKLPYRLLYVHKMIADEIKHEIVSHECYRLAKKGWIHKLEREYVYAECVRSNWRGEYLHDYTIPEQELCDYYSKCAAEEILQMYETYLFSKYMKAPKPADYSKDEDIRYQYVIKASNLSERGMKDVPVNEDDFYPYILASKNPKKTGLIKKEIYYNFPISNPQIVLNESNDKKICYRVDHLEDIFILCFDYILKSKEYVFRCPNCHKLFHKNSIAYFCNDKCSRKYARLIENLSEEYKAYEKTRKRLVARKNSISKQAISSRQKENVPRETAKVDEKLGAMKAEFKKFKEEKISSEKFKEFLEDIESYNNE